MHTSFSAWIQQCVSYKISGWINYLMSAMYKNVYWVSIEMFSAAEFFGEQNAFIQATCFIESFDFGWNSATCGKDGMSDVSICVASDPGWQIFGICKMLWLRISHTLVFLQNLEWCRSER